MFSYSQDLHLDFRLRASNLQVTLTDDLQIHTIELPKYTPPDNNERITNEIEQWAYFLRFAPNLTVAEIETRLSDSVFSEAAKVLEMIAKTLNERNAYDARVKFQRDEAARLLHARQEGEVVGDAKGKIRLLCQLLGISVVANEDLDGLDLSSLNKLAADLQEQLRERG